MDLIEKKCDECVRELRWTRRAFWTSNLNFLSYRKTTDPTPVSLPGDKGPYVGGSLYFGTSCCSG